jgi:hypothetical protein
MNQLFYAMKKYFLNILLLSGLLFLAGNLIVKTVVASGAVASGDYEKLWEEVESLEMKGQPRSAIAVVDRIWQMAMEEKDEPQMIRALEYRIRLGSRFLEDHYREGIEQINAAFAHFSEPSVQVLHSLLADLYMGYYFSNRYKILDRTNVEGYELTDMESWDQKAFAEKIFGELRLSLENPALLQQTPAGDYSAILDNEDSLHIFRPTLYDLLAQRALDFYKNDEFMAGRPALRFEIDKPGMLDIAGSFVKLALEEKESFSMKFHALELYQQLIAFHLHDPDPGVLVDLDLNRLSFVYGHATFPDKDEAYLHSLQQMENKYIGHEAVAEVYYYIAKFYDRSANLYQPLISDDHARDRLIAAEYCRLAIREYPDSYGTALCKTLLRSIETKSLDCQVMHANLPAKPILASIGFRNVETIYLRVVELDPHEPLSRKGQQNDEQLLEEFRKMRPVKQWSAELPAETDYQQHRSEIAIPPLTEGYYGLMLSDNPGFEKARGIVSITRFWTTNISYIKKVDESGNLMYYVLGRATGKSMPGVRVKLYEEVYDRAGRDYRLSEKGSYTTDAEGYFSVQAGEGSRGRLIMEFTKGDDSYITPNHFYISKKHQSPERSYDKTYFFTDRAIYRPGQSVYFKGILLTRTGERYELQKNCKTTVAFYDANNQKVSELKLKTNDYGSFHASFTAPVGGLTGNMRIQNESGQTSFAVEEYKRPGFEVLFDPLRGSYRLNASVTVKGRAVAYAGNPLGQVQVKYRIVRNAWFPYRYYAMAYLPESREAEIASGLTKTDENGNFSIEFTAIPDAALSQKLQPSFNYTIYVDVTDPSGETQSGQKTVSVGTKSLLIHLDMPELLNSNDLQDYSLRTTNLNGEPEPGTLALKIIQLQGPGQVLQERTWQRPDIYMIGESNFREMFPNTAYRDEDNKENWEEVKTVYSKKFNTAEKAELEAVLFKKWSPGAYKVVMTTRDIFGEEVKSTHFFTLFDPASKSIPLQQASWFVPLKTLAEPGEKASFLVGSSFREVQILYELTGKQGLVKREWINLSGEQRLIEIPVGEEDRGNLGVNLVFVSHNRNYNKQVLIRVPHTDKKLDISFATFREKLLPGQEESWNIRIRSSAGEKVAAEMLAGMYDASLDAFRPQQWLFSLYQETFFFPAWDAQQAFVPNAGRIYRIYRPYESPPPRVYNSFVWSGLYSQGFGYPGYGIKSAVNMRNVDDADFDGALPLAEGEAVEDAVPVSEQAEALPVKDRDPVAGEGRQEIQIRRDLRETAFFFPDLKTNEDGDILISFTVPEALTRWKMMGLAHTQDLRSGLISRELVTSKDLMVMPNQPRFFREGDEIWFSARVVNLAEKTMKGTATLELYDAISMKKVSNDFGIGQEETGFEAAAGGSSHVSWKLSIPHNTGPVMYRIIAESGDFSDGEEMVIPVLKNRMLVTESMPLPVKGNESRTFHFQKLAESQVPGTTLTNYSYTLEFTANPAWYAVQALPYLMEYPYECSEQIFNRVYANGLAAHIIGRHPKIKNVFESWMNITPDALLSNLEKNQDLKNALLEETPWVLQAKDESERKKRLGLLFDLNRMEYNQAAAISKLQQNQLGNGGWPWFAGGRDNRYITQYIVSGFGKMLQLGVMEDQPALAGNMLRNAIAYMDERILDDLNRIREKDKDYLKNDHLGMTQIQYLYARSYFLGRYEIDAKYKEAFLYFKEQAKKYWGRQNKYLQGMIALALHRMDEKPLPMLIMTSIREHALYDDEMGMYWRSDAGYYWHEAPVETQALLTGAFMEIMKDTASVELMKTWLLKNKQTRDWKTTRATADACYALLMQGADLITEEGEVQIEVGGEIFDPANVDGLQKEAGTGYFRHRWAGSEIRADMADIRVTKTNEGIAWGAVYWQYFEDLDKITAHASPLSIVKKLFRETNTPEGPVLVPVNGGDALKPGDKLVSRIEIRSDRDMEFVHLKDMRAAALEPRSNLSGYRWQGGLGYYESIRDASVNFFFSYLPKGTWVFEYPLNVSQRGSFSNGISSIQCMYAPEFGAHSEGVSFIVE